ncbi:hypothetical protein [Sphingomonas sp. IW22]|uniref:hypothetical protein n=1 Tax=Sphingomonas sp. IW22 TaxID=3242489 RepID=UPI00351FBE49
MTIIFGGRRAPSGEFNRFYPLDPTLPEVTRHRPLALAILADYGNPTVASDRVSAIMDWIARTAIHGHSGLRLPTPYTAGTAALPVGETWATVQAWLTAEKQQADTEYWATFNHDAAAMLNVLLGTLQADGSRAQDGAMVQVAEGGAQAHYKYRELSKVRSVWCSWQHDIATLLLATLGYPSMLIHITGHDPLRVQYGDRGEWGYWCSTYNEHYSLAGDFRPLDIAELRDLTQGGMVTSIARQPHTGPSWDPEPYVSASYIADHPEGFPVWSASLDSRIVPNGRTNRLTLWIDDALVPFEVSARVSEARATPYLGAYVAGVPLTGLNAATVHIVSSWPGTTELQVRRGVGSWSQLTLGNTGTVRVFAGENDVTVAPLDATGQRGPAVVLGGPLA